MLALKNLSLQMDLLLKLKAVGSNLHLVSLHKVTVLSLPTEYILVPQCILLQKLQKLPFVPTIIMIVKSLTSLA